MCPTGIFRHGNCVQPEYNKTESGSSQSNLAQTVAYQSIPMNFISHALGLRLSTSYLQYFWFFLSILSSVYQREAHIQPARLFIFSRPWKAQLYPPLTTTSNFSCFPISLQYCSYFSISYWKALLNPPPSLPSPESQYLEKKMILTVISSHHH